MEYTRETLDNYRKNLWCLQEVTGKLLSHIKGRDFSFRPAVTDKNGDFAEEKLRVLVEELLSGWAEELRDGVYPDRSGAESPAKGYIQTRQELYGLYLYLVMRCSLCEGTYALTGGDEEPERADFAFLYRQAPAEVLRSFCEELEQIVDLYLLRHGLAALTDTDKTLDVYSRVFDGPCRYASCYARGMLWKTL